MPIRHGTHHGLSFILSILFGVLLSELIRKFMPGFFDLLENWSKIIINIFKINISTKTMSILMLAFVMAIIYGIIFGILERKRN